MIAICFNFVEINSKSIHVHGGFHSDFEINGEKPLNHTHNNSTIASWLKLKPILHQEMQHVREVKGNSFYL